MSRNNVSPQRPLSRYLLKQVAQGDYGSLHTFIERLNANTVSLEAFDALLNFFQKDPKSVNTLLAENLHMGSVALEALRRLISLVAHEAHLTDQLMADVEAKLCDSAGRLAIWMEESIHLAFQLNRDSSVLDIAVLGIGGAIESCLSLQGSIMEAMMVKPQVVKALLRLWAFFPACNTEKLLSGPDALGRSMVVAPMVTFLKAEAGEQLLHNAFVDSPKELRTFCRATSIRFAQVPDYAPPEGIVLDILQAQQVFLKDIWAVAFMLSKRPDIHKALCDADYLACSTRTLVKLAPRLTPRALLEMGLPILLRCLEAGSNPPSSLQSILDSGLLDVAACKLSANPDDVVPSGKVIFMVKLEPYVLYPRIHKAVLRVKDRLDPKIAEILPTLPSTGRFWTRLLERQETIAQRLEQREKQVVYPICDNDKLHEPSPNPQSRLCSNCRLVLYCSVECQREDWEKRHRAECNVMRCTYRDRHQQSIRYGQHARAFHLSYIGSVLTQQHGEKQGLKDEASCATPILSLDLRFHVMEGLPHLIMPLSIEEYLNHRMRGDCAAIQARVQSMAQRFVDRSSSNEWLVEARIPWTTERSVVLLARMALIEGRFLATHSVVQIQDLPMSREVMKEYYERCGFKGD
ncbi:hypothetical protein BKA70DRAFT_1573859 [Coprinopsis sp. MPI-PUGE-AT-0042]|nr:hypothetical protein BKA70DRAFT_1573859 [Coprinopsis sp. MPI-PUGE-AT-0042]